MKTALLSLLAGFAAVLASCTSSSPTSRIENNPTLFKKISPLQQGFVELGQIKNGMNKDAVFLAWGQPDSIANGESEKGLVERWTYTSLRPVYSNSLHFGYGHGFHRSCRYGRRGHRFGYGQAVDYVPVRSAVVHFKNGQVTKWERGSFNSLSAF